MSTDLRKQLLATLGSAYTLHHELGHGGMAVVYLATDLRHHRLVALKALQPEFATELGAVRFHREVETAAKLSHPHILPLFDSGEASGLLWYAMPYVDGESLRDRLRREKLLPVDEAVRIACQAADALAYAHRRGVVHRDIKPENILLHHGHALVADFGIARAMAEVPDPLTVTGATLGTPAYMSPECASGERELDGRVDVYSLGCILFEMLAGEPPFTGPTPQAVLAKRMRQPAPRVCTLRETVPDALDRALARALSRVPADRFATAEQFAEALLLPDARNGRERAGSGGRRAAGSRWRVRLAAAIAFVLVAAGVATWRAPNTPAAQAASGPPRVMVVVLPFKNLGRPDDMYFADGVTEEITSRLASVQGLGIISRTSADQYRNSAKPLREMARELGVGYVLEGSVRWDRLGGEARHVRVTPQLIRVSDDSHVWAQRYDADADSMLAAQAYIAQEVTAAIVAALRGPMRSAAPGPAIGARTGLTSLWTNLVRGRPQRRIPVRPRIVHEAAGRVGSPPVTRLPGSAGSFERERHLDGRQEGNQRLIEHPNRLGAATGSGEQPRSGQAIEIALRAQRVGQRE